MAKPLGMCQVGIKSESIKIYICQIMNYYIIQFWQLNTFIMTFTKGKTFCSW
jgi:hypothetical protein